ncbi:serine protease inhibitor dipetalogastin-like [Battus philenor]|uniref:serine protease inhibitor dipetalogastin-like n=1 Tax=Battus philenor TaxID=42288 RepID=UPI0035CEB4A8
MECESKNDQLKGYPPIHESYDCKDCVCRNVDLPVCAMDGTTYPNECEIDCINRNRIKQGFSIINLAYRKQCLGPSCDCNNIASPVCGSDDVLYRSECVLECASQHAISQGLPEIKVKNVGACSDGCSCPDTKQPVCGNDGKTYHNPCELECENDCHHGEKYNKIKISYNGKCEECSCKGPYDPVCGNDGNTYHNQCEFDCENTRRYHTGQPLIESLGNGECVKCFCETVNEPVCGTDGQTYSNDCVRQCENEARLQKGYQGVNVMYQGKCVKQDTCVCSHCTDTYDPVCGSDGATHWNYCWMDCYSKCNESQEHSKIEFVKYGPCV